MDFRSIIRNIPDFPQDGVLFRDITPVLLNPDALSESIKALKELTWGIDFDLVAGPESRGFIFGVPLAIETHKGFIPVRKSGKLPFDTLERSYELEYGSAAIEIHADAIKKGQRVIVVDDLLATGGTCKALCELIEDAGGIVAGCVFFIELTALNGRKALEGRKILSIVRY